MTLQIKTYSPIPKVTFNPDNLLRLPGFNTDSLIANISTAGGLKLLRIGSTIATDGKLLKRSKLLTGAAAGATEIYVTNPWAFAIGDAIRVIAAPGATAAVELAAIVGATGVSLGTISSIEGSLDTQISRITPASAVVGNIITVDFQGCVASYKILTAVLTDELTGLAKAIEKALYSADDLRYVTVANMGTYLKIESTQSQQIVEFIATIDQGAGASIATMATSTDKGLGKITLSAPLPSALIQGTKIGTVTQTPQAIFDSEYDFTDYPAAIHPEHAICPCYGGHFYSDAFYLDGQIVKELNQAKFLPAYV